MSNLSINLFYNPFVYGKILRRINQRKELCSIQIFSDDEDDQDDDSITPYTYHDFCTQVYSPQQDAPVEACVPICEPFPKKSEKYPSQGDLRFKSKISEKSLFQL